MMERSSSRLLTPRSDVAAIAEDVEPYVGTSVEDRAAIMESLCEFAAEQIAARPDGSRILAFVDRRSKASVALWQSLVDRYRAAS